MLSNIQMLIDKNFYLIKLIRQSPCILMAPFLNIDVKTAIGKDNCENPRTRNCRTRDKIVN